MGTTAVHQGTKAAPARALPIQLSFREKDGQVVIEPDNQDRYVTTVDEAIKATWQKQFVNLLGVVHNWCREHQENVTAAYIAIRDRGLGLFIVTDSKRYDFALADEVTKLDVALCADYPNQPVNTMQLPRIPEEGQMAFFDPSSTLQVYAK